MCIGNNKHGRIQDINLVKETCFYFGRLCFSNFSSVFFNSSGGV